MYIIVFLFLCFNKSIIYIIVKRESWKYVTFGYINTQMTE